ncbi:39S ribosomal protein L22, mitochondrial [Leptopilina boulardi]|uniref:39S ribosomal protein L22, mitochondrial n=1 Tax=Leptopilina boulardi TaxID=63433 RepID=UPI0021F532A1|nr:39S ribosomal protein L22, mitochondrial [Leptopilina boulardi]
MQSLTNCMQRLLGKQLLQPNLVALTQTANFEKHSSFEDYNNKFYPIQAHDEERRPAFVCHVEKNVKYSPKNMWYVANLIRGMTIDDAIDQISFVLKKGGAIVKEALLAAQKKAVEEHNVEFKSNLWVSESFCNKGIVIKGIRKHAKQRVGEVRYTYCHYYLTLEEGKPPKHYYHYKSPKSKEELLQNYKEKLRMRRVINSL